MSTKSRITEVASRPYWREADARAIVKAWQASDETRGRFAPRHGVHRGRLSRGAVRLARVEPAPVRFHPGQVAVDGVASGGAGAPIEIEVGAGRDRRVIRVAPGFVADDVRRALAVLDERPTCGRCPRRCASSWRPKPWICVAGVRDSPPRHGA